MHIVRSLHTRHVMTSLQTPQHSGNLLQKLQMTSSQTGQREEDRQADAEKEERE